MSKLTEITIRDHDGDIRAFDQDDDAIATFHGATGNLGTHEGWLAFARGLLERHPSISVWNAPEGRYEISMGTRWSEDEKRYELDALRK